MSSDKEGKKAAAPKKETPTKAGGTSSSSPASTGSPAKSSISGGEPVAVRHSVRATGPSPMQKAKPQAPPPERKSGNSTPLTPSGGKRKSPQSGSPSATAAAAGPAGVGSGPTPSAASPQLPPSAPPAGAGPSDRALPPKATGAVGAKGRIASTTVTALDDGPMTPPPSQQQQQQQAGATDGSGAVPCSLQRLPSTRCGAFVRVVDYAVTAEQGVRRTMEDQHIMLAEGIPFFGVYDGHGGTQCAEYLRDNLHTLILSHPEIKTNPEKAITDSIVKADADFLQGSEEENNESGSVCAVALILDDVLVVGNVGDCEAVLCRGGNPIVLTTKHTLQSNPGEVVRVQEAGGRVYNHRVGHPRFNPSLFNLAVTRAIGDAGFKLDEYTEGRRSGVIAVPDTKSIRLVREDEFLIIGCDGLWDVMSYGEVVDFCIRRFRSGDVAQGITDELAQAALNRGGTDNVTAMLVHLTRRGGSDGGEVYPETAMSTSVRNLCDDEA